MDQFTSSTCSSSRIGAFASGMMGPSARDNMSFEEYHATVSVEEMHAKSREYAHLLESKFGIVDSVVHERATQLF